ncbi:MAG TPA: hypothetical protein PKX92_08885 [Edaphocola sp.]|nr:hypothetical protein [Edaphocola sp.]
MQFSKSFVLVASLLAYGWQVNGQNKPLSSDDSSNFIEKRNEIGIFGEIGRIKPKP